MKAGRPSFNIPAKWITINHPQGLMYFELDNNGKLISKVNKAHHIVNRAPSAVQQSTNSAPIQENIPEVQIQPIQPPSENPPNAHTSILEPIESFADFNSDFDFSDPL
jgi:hypothetical protein